MADLDCSSGVIILGVIAGVHVILSMGLLGCIIWCACCYGKRQLKVRPLSPKHSYYSTTHRVSSPDESTPTISSPTMNQRELKHLKLISQLEAKRLQTISETGTLASSDNESVTITSVTTKDTSFTKNNSRSNENEIGDSSPVLKNAYAWEGNNTENKSNVSDESHGESSSSSNNESVFANPNVEEKAPAVSVPGLSTIENWKREAIIARRKAKRTNSTRPLLMSSISSDIGGSVSEDIDGSCMSLPTIDGSPNMRVLTRHAGSRKRRTDSMKSLVDYERNCSTLPRTRRLPPVTAPRPLSTTPLSPLQTLSENVPLATESVTNLTAIERPKPIRQSSEEERLPRLSLHLANDMGLELNENKYRSVV